MRYDFDEKVERRGSGCVKFDVPQVRPDQIPLWVADMDFRTPDFILDALRARIDHPVMGYAMIPENYFEIIRQWVRNLHGWEVPTSWMRYIPGIVRGMGMVLGAFCKPGDKVIILSPVYHPFRLVPEKNGFEVLRSPLVPIYDDEGFLETYKIDFKNLDSLASDPSAKVLILSNPHNPCGIVWDEEQLCELSRICRRHGVLVVSDEIHAEMVLNGGRHIPFATVSEDAASNSITFMAPSKTFNIAGIVSSFTVVPDPSIRERFFSYLDANEFDAPSIFSMEATVAAYSQGGEWREQMLNYVWGNACYVDERLRKDIPSIHCVLPQASFLVWLDCRRLGLSQTELVTLFEDKAGLYLNDGSMFGPEGEGFMRLNIGCPRSTLAEALDRLMFALRQDDRTASRNDSDACTEGFTEMIGRIPH